MAFSSAGVIAARIAQGELSPVEVVSNALARINEVAGLGSPPRRPLT